MEGSQWVHHTEKDAPDSNAISSENSPIRILRKRVALDELLYQVAHQSASMTEKRGETLSFPRILHGVFRPIFTELFKKLDKPASWAGSALGAPGIHRWEEKMQVSTHAQKRIYIYKTMLWTGKKRAEWRNQKGDREKRPCVILSSSSDDRERERLKAPQVSFVSHTEQFDCPALGWPVVCLLKRTSTCW